MKEYLQGDNFEYDKDLDNAFISTLKRVENITEAYVLHEVGRVAYDENLLAWELRSTATEETNQLLRLKDQQEIDSKKLHYELEYLDAGYEPKNAAGYANFFAHMEQFEQKLTDVDYVRIDFYSLIIGAVERDLGDKYQVAYQKDEATFSTTIREGVLLHIECGVDDDRVKTSASYTILDPNIPSAVEEIDIEIKDEAVAIDGHIPAAIKAQFLSSLNRALSEYSHLE